MDANTIVFERLAILETKAKAAHERIDRMEIGVREDLADIKKSVHVLSSEIRVMFGEIKYARGGIAVLCAVAGAAGFIGSLLAKLLFRS